LGLNSHLPIGTDVSHCLSMAGLIGFPSQSPQVVWCEGKVYTLTADHSLPSLFCRWARSWTMLYLQGNRSVYKPILLPDIRVATFHI